MIGTALSRRRRAAIRAVVFDLAALVGAFGGLRAGLVHVRAAEARASGRLAETLLDGIGPLLVRVAGGVGAGVVTAAAVVALLGLRDG